MPNESLDAAMIASLLATDDKQKQAKRASAIKSKKFPTEPRNYDTWFGLQSHFGECTNASCTDPRDNIVGKTMVAEVNGSDICRYCFLNGVNRITHE